MFPVQPALHFFPTGSLHCLALLFSGTLPMRCEKGVEEISFQSPYCPFIWSTNSYGVPAGYCTARQLRTKQPSNTIFAL